MKLSMNSELWGRIFYNLREEFYRLNSDGHRSQRQVLQEFFKGYDVIIKTDIDGRWEEVEIVLDDEELTIFLMRWL